MTAIAALRLPLDVDLSGFVGFNPVISALNAGGGDDQLTLNQTGTGVVDTGSGNDTVAGRMGDGSLTLGGGNDRVDMAVLGSGVQIKPLVVAGGAGVDNITIVTTRALLTVTVLTALDARLRVIPHLTAQTLPAMGRRIGIVTVTSVLFVVVGVSFRGGLFG